MNSKSKPSRTKNFCLLREVEEHDVRSMIKEKEKTNKKANERSVTEI